MIEWVNEHLKWSVGAFTYENKGNVWEFFGMSETDS
jgi:hypothetical protein